MPTLRALRGSDGSVGKAAGFEAEHPPRARQLEQAGPKAGGFAA